MKIDEKIKTTIKKGAFIPNSLMPLKEEHIADLFCDELIGKRGYTLRTEPSDIRKIYEKQASINILNEKR